MQNGSLPLSPEKELGLIGELSFLCRIINAGITSNIAIESWVGPTNDGTKDFKLGFGAFEVKSTLSSNRFIAHIGSLEQLDDSTTKPLYLAALKFNLTDNGETLNEKVEEIRKKIKGDLYSLLEFDNRLLASGYSTLHESEYHRRFYSNGFTILEVDNDFPRITSNNVKLGVISAKYEISLDSLLKMDVGINSALKKLKMI
jgi:hypothetical protein